MNSNKKAFLKSIRYYENDWLTILATLAAFLFLYTRFFNDEGWHVNNPVESTTLSIVVVIVLHWIMPLFFILSGMSRGYAFKSRTTLQYFSDIVERLMISFLLIFFASGIPVQGWIERVTHSAFSGSFIEFSPPHDFDGFYVFGGNFAWMRLHLWYLLIYFCFP
ncbi:hypothetical protein [Salidesulfovibrio brasiliensis]|uniref:hypothetical protein n=1 Tax=Salidesulfovibrio brasiliensis TaxID=221711 RepID=UPI0006D10ED0|nr:hypothetical protein [Salidesulfovibrio brasiliensis]